MKRTDRGSSYEPRRLREFPSFLLWIFNPWVIGGALAVALVLLLATLGLLFATRSRAPILQPTAVLITIAAPTSTPIPPTPTPLSSPTPSLAVPLPPEAGEIAVGMYVKITNTEGDGLRLRVDPGLNGEVRLLGGESEVFLVKDGPKDVDGFQWWYLVGATDETRQGWGVANYLAVVPSP